MMWSVSQIYIQMCVCVFWQQDFSKQQITHCQASTEQGKIEQLDSNTVVARFTTEVNI